MKRYGNLFKHVIAFENLDRAFQKAIRGKRNQPEVIDFIYNKEKRVFDLQKQLEEGTYTFGPYQTFMIHDPKPRNIVAAPFRDRIVHHAMCNVMDPIFDRTFIFDSYACRAGKGVHKAILRVQNYMRKIPEGYVLQCDIRKYFQSVDWKILKGLIRRKLKDPRLLQLVDAVIESAPIDPEFGPGKGLPIGNLTSQLFANVYLNPMDHFVKEDLRCHYYVRYVDDWVVLDKDKKRLEDVRQSVRDFAHSRLKLRLHTDKCHISPIRKGITFLGYRFNPKWLRVKTSTMVRIRRKEKALRQAYWQGLLDADAYWCRVASMVGHIKWGYQYSVLIKQILS